MIKCREVEMCNETAKYISGWYTFSSILVLNNIKNKLKEKNTEKSGNYFRAITFRKSNFIYKKG